MSGVASQVTSTVLGLSPDTWSAIGSGGSAGALLIGAIAVVMATLEYLSGRQARRDQERPYMVLTIEQSEADESLIDISVRNIGSTPAHELRVEVDPPLKQAADGDALSNARIFNETITFWPPGHELRFFFDSHLERAGRDLPTVYRATLTYGNGRGGTWSETSILDLDLHAGTTYVKTYGLHDAAKALHKMEKILDKSSLLKKGELEVVTEARDVRRARTQEESGERRRRREELTARLLPKADDATSSTESPEPRQPPPDRAEPAE